MSVRHGRHLRPVAGLVLVLLVVTSASGCLGTLEPQAPVVPTGASFESPEVTDADPDAPTPEPGVLRIQGDQVLDRLAERMHWEGSGTFADPYRIIDLELQDTLLVFQDISRAVTLTRATLTGPAEGPALMVWNATAFSVEASTVRAQAGPAVSFLEASWSRITGSVLTSEQEAVLAVSSEAIDLVDNDIHAGTSALRFEAGNGDHWIEGNRIHRSETAVEIIDETRPSALYDNVLKGETGLKVRQTPGPLLDGNVIEAHDGLVLHGAHDAMLLDTTAQVTGTAARVTESDRVLIEGLDITGTARGVEIRDSQLTLVANLTYAGPGPAIHVEGGDTPVVAGALILLPRGEAGDGIVMRDTHAPVLLDVEIADGARGIVLDGTTDAAVIDSHASANMEAGVLLQETTATLIAESVFMGSAGHAILIEGGTRHQIAENRFGFNHLQAVSATGTTDLDVAFNQIDRGDGIAVLDSIRPVIDRNTLNGTTFGVQVTDGGGASIHGNTIRSVRGIIVERHQGEEGLFISQNEVSGSGLNSEAVHLVEVRDLTMRGNALLSKNGLVLADVTHGLVYDNYFDNSLDVVASGQLDVQWDVPPRPGTNVVGGAVVAGNWWHDYTGVDLDQDGIGDLPHGLLPYEEDLGNLLPGVGSYGVQDDAPIVSNGTAPGTPTSTPDRHPGAERLADLFGQHPALDRILATYA